MQWGLGKICGSTSNTAFYHNYPLNFWERDYSLPINYCLPLNDNHHSSLSSQDPDRRFKVVRTELEKPITLSVYTPFHA